LFEYERTCYLGLGANKGDKKDNLVKALTVIGQKPGITLLRHSSIYQSEPIGVSRQPEFYNCVAEIRTVLEPHGLLHLVKNIEAELGREPNSHMLPRIIDIDILLFGDLEVDSLDLMIPHSRLTRRAFVLVPLLELNPELVHPVNLRPLKEFFDSITPPQKVRKVIDAGELFERTKES
jgi:2-amino-4-hydroxy-6-hydroxymethyldihydropteridine diphosphokinase